MASDDPDGFDQAQRDEVRLRLAAMQATHERQRRIATMTPLEIAEYDLAATLEVAHRYAAGKTSFAITDSNTRAMAEEVASRRAEVDRLRRT